MVGMFEFQARKRPADKNTFHLRIYNLLFMNISRLYGSLGLT
jgi:hypothetical protein